MKFLVLLEGRVSSLWGMVGFYSEEGYVLL